VTAGSSRLFRFAQLEFPWALGPEDGRYVVRHHAGEAPDWVVVLATLGAERRRLPNRRRSRPRPVSPAPAPVAVETSRATVIAATPLASAPEGPAWLATADAEQEVGEAVRVLNRMLHAHRVAAADPYLREVAREQALVARVGYGDGEQVAQGRWADAVEVPAPEARARRTAALRPQERLAALLGGRDAALACEELALRARGDLNAGRPREAALQVRIALEAALSELSPWTGRGDLAARLEALRAERDSTGAFAHAALEGGLDERQAADVDRVLQAIETALRARTALGFD
jgi:hypothetical protein